MTSAGSLHMRKRKWKSLWSKQMALEKKKKRRTFNSSHWRRGRRFWPSMEKTSFKSLRARFLKSSCHVNSSLATLKIFALNTWTSISALTNTFRKPKSTKKNQNWSRKRLLSGKKWVAFKKIKRKGFRDCSVSKICPTSRRCFCKSTPLNAKQLSTYFQWWSALEYLGPTLIAWSRKNASLETP